MAEHLFKLKLDNSTDLTGQSTLVLLLPHNTPNDQEKQFAESRRNNILKSYLPGICKNTARTKIDTYLYF